jgi:hypothetical protein
VSLFQLTAEDYLEVVKDWTDPMPAPVLEEHESVTVVRDDLLPAGSKSRFIDYMIRSAPDVDEWVYGNSPRVGYGQISLAYVAAKYGRRSTLFLAASKELHPNTQRAVDFGATVYQVPTGFMTVCASRARAYVAEGQGRRLVPFGLADASVYGSIIKVARALPIVPDEVWSVAGSGVLNRGLQMAWPTAECYMVSVGHALTDEEIGRAIMFRHPMKFPQKTKKPNRPPFPSVLEYDAKAWQFVREKSFRNDRRVLFWNVGS